MPVQQFYIIITLVIALIIVSSVLGTVAILNTSKVNKLQSFISVINSDYAKLYIVYKYLEENYTVLWQEYEQLELQYSQLQSQYAQLWTQYSQFKANYTNVISNYQALNETFIYLRNAVMYYKSITQPIAYATFSTSINGSVIFLNITNPTNDTVNMTISIYVESPFYENVLPIFTMVLLPPRTTISIPIMLMLFNSSVGLYVNPTLSEEVPGISSMNSLKSIKFMITVFTNELSALGLSGITFNSSAIKIIALNKPMGYAIYYQGNTSLELYLENPLSTTIIINGYDIYTYNNVLLTSCSLNMPIPLNAISINMLLLPTETETYYLTSLYTISPSKASSIKISLATTCTVNYQFPNNTSELPYGYVILNTNIGNITIPLIPQSWWRYYYEMLNVEERPGPICFGFNLYKALEFYESLNTSVGLLREYPGSNTIWLADDQALDYNALMLIYEIINVNTAKDLAEQILNAIKPYGGLYAYYNDVFELFGIYPSTTAPYSGVNIFVGTIGPYTLKATAFTHPMPNYYEYADLLAYRVLFWLHLGDYTKAEEDFVKLVGMWDGVGFKDAAYNGIYQSYKLALFLIVWKTLESNPHTHAFAMKYLNIAKKVAEIMSQLQDPQTGGVWTGYLYINGKLQYGYAISLMNGETTSLFVIAYALACYNISLPIQFQS
mgnify:CR=1 FL=1